MAIDNKEMEFTEEEIAYILSSISSAPADGYGQVSKNKAIHTTAHRKLIAKIAQKFGVLLNETNNIQETLTQLKDLLGEKQNQSDDTLNTQSKKIVEAINELLGINQDVSIKAGVAYDEAVEAKTTANDARIVAGIAYENANTALTNSSTALQQAKAYTDEQIANYGLYIVVSELPETGLPNKIYLVPTTNATENNTYDEYLWVNGTWEFQGSGKASVNLDDYVEKVNTVASTGRVYGVTAVGTQEMIPFSKDTLRGAIAQRKETGALATVMPVNDEDSTPMAYVDNLPAYLTLTEDTTDESGTVVEGTKTKWQDWLGLGDTKIKEIVAETYLVGETVPTTETVAQFRGQLYVDTAGDGTYQCTAITTDESTGVKSYTWVKLIRSTDEVSPSTAGIVKGGNYGLRVLTGQNGMLAGTPRTLEQYSSLNASFVIAKGTLGNIRSNYVKLGVTANDETLTDDQQTNACDWLGAVKKTTSEYKLYGTDANGKAVLLGYTNGMAGSNIVQRNPDGSIQTIVSTGEYHAVNNKRMISYVGNLPDNLTLTENTSAESGEVSEGTKAKWQHWLGLGIIIGKLEQEIGTVGAFYPIIPDTWNFAEVPVVPKLGVLYYDVMGGRFLRWVGRTFIDTAFLLPEPVNVRIANFPYNVASDDNVVESEAKATWQNWLEVKKLYCHYYMFKFQGMSGALTFYSTNGTRATTFYDLAVLLSTRRGGINGYVDSIMCNVYACEVLGGTTIQLIGVYITGGDSQTLSITEGEFEFGVVTTVHEV